MTDLPALHVERFGAGPGAGPRAPLVLLHGFGSGSFTWGPALDAGLGADREAVAFDRFGFGRSPRPPAGSWDGVNPYSLAGAVRSTAAVIADTGWPDVVLVGHSAGALVALAYALEHPGAVRGLVLLAPAVIDAGPPAAVAAAFRLPLARRWGPALLRAGRPLVGRSVASTWHDAAALERSGMAAAYAASTDEDGWAEGLVELTLATAPTDAAAVVARLGEVTVPTIVVVGADDRVVRAAASRRLVEDLGDAHLVVVPSCGHVPHEERPLEVVEAVAPFLASVDDRTASG